MKTIKLFTLLAALFFVFNGNLNAQEDEKAAKYITRTTMHWNMNKDDFSMKDWKAIEKEYLDKVVMKNEHIMGASFFMHQFTADNTTLEYVQVFESWDAIEKAADRSAELAEEAWPDEKARGDFFDKRNDFYSNEHSDEIYAVMGGAKPLAEMPTKDLTLYMRIRHFAFPEDGTFEEWKELRDSYLENVVHKNEYVLGYYPSRHYYGTDRTEYIEAFYVEDVAALDKMLDRMPELVEETWSEEERKERGRKGSKYYTGVHEDYIYTYVSGLSK
jgi:hypothetical protein